MKYEFKKSVALLLSLAIAMQPVTAYASEIYETDPAEPEIVLSEEVVPEIEETSQETEVAAPEVEENAEENVSGEEESLARLTLMYYGVGSDLERNSFSLTSDLTELVAGMDAARLSAGEGTEVKDLPINVIVETGGSSYNPTASDRQTVAQKVKARVDMAGVFDPNEAPFDKYDKKIGELIGDTEGALQSYSIFNTLADGNYTETVTTPEGLEETIKWNKNQRWQLIPDVVDTKRVGVEPAKSQPQDPDRSMVYTDETGFIPELYEFVSTTMQDYPAEQYALILWDHGGGCISGFGTDERDSEVDENGDLKTSGDSAEIRADHIRKTFGKLKEDMGESWQEFAFAGFDACYMADVDDVLAWQDYTRYFIASEATEAGDGWYYIPWMYTLSMAAMDDKKDDFALPQTMDTLSELVGIEAVDSFNDWYVEKEGHGTLALFDLSDDKTVSDFVDAIDELSEAFVEFFVNDPAEAFRAFYYGNKNAVNLSDETSGRGDLRSLCVKIKEQLSEQAEIFDEERAVYEKADALVNMLPVSEGSKENGIVRYYRNAGVYETEKTMGGVSLYTPYASAADRWTDWRNIYGSLEGRQSYKNLMGIYAAIQEAGKVLYEIYSDTEHKYDSEQSQKDAVEIVLKAKLKDFEVTVIPEETIDETVSALFDERITKKDCEVISRNDSYYSNLSHWDLVDDIYQHPEITFSNSEGELSLYLGYLKDGKQEDDGLKLERFNKDPEWFYLSSGEKSYPLNLYSIDEDKDPFKDELSISAPAFILTVENGKYSPSRPVLLDISFDKDSNEGSVNGYWTVDVGFPDAPNRYYENARIPKNVFIVPLYDYVEMVRGDKQSYMELKDKDGNYLLKPTRLKEAVIGRGAITQETMNDMAAELKDWAYEPGKTLGEGAEGKFGSTHVIRDMFQAEYVMEPAGEQESKKKATVMLYGVGSDLERESFSLSYDMTEIATALTAAKNKLNVSELPVNVVADLGGVSFEPAENEKQQGITREDKISNRATARDGITTNAEDFKKYTAIIKELTGDESVDPYTVFNSITPDNGDIVDWEKNQRYEICPLTEGDNGEKYILFDAQNKYETGATQREVAMTASDEDGVVTELYDFVKTTMEKYPSEQYILVFWDHGGGAIYGFGSDERKQGGINSYNIKQTFEKLKEDSDSWQPLTMVGYDACLMGGTETAEVWTGFADYLVGSEAIEPGDGWDHIGWIYQLCEEAVKDDEDAFAQSGSMGKITEKLGKTAVNDFVKWYKTDDRSTLATLALVKLDRSGIKNLGRAADDFSDAMTEFIKKKPDIGFSVLYDARDEGAGFSELADLRSIAVKTKEKLGADEDPLATEAAQKADGLIKVFDSKNPVLYYKNTGYLDGVIDDDDDTELGGLNRCFPYQGDPQGEWGEYLKIYEKISPDTDSWRDLMGSYMALRAAGALLKDVFEEKYLTPESAEAAIRASLSEVLKDNNVSSDVANALLSVAPGKLYDQRIVPDDLDVVKIFDDHYYIPTPNKPLQKGVAQPGVLWIGDKWFGLGVLPGGTKTRTDENGMEGIKLYNYGKDYCWVWTKSKDGETVYPASVYETIYRDEYGDTMNEPLKISVPVSVYKEADSKWSEKSVYLNVYFDRKTHEAEIIDYSEIDVTNPLGNSRIYDVDDLKGKYILPLYNVEEKLIEGRGGDLEVPSGSDGNHCQAILFEDLVVSRGTEENGLDIIKKANPKVAENDIIIDTRYFLRDKFDQNYELKKKEYKSFGIKWKTSTSVKRILPGKTLISTDDLEPVVKIDGADQKDETETNKYAANILANVWLDVNGVQTLLSAQGYTLPEEGTVSLFLRDEDLTAEKMEPGYADKTEQEQADLRKKWSNDIYPAWDRVRPTVSIVKTKVGPDDPRSGMDKEMKITKVSDNLFRMEMVKGQACTLGKGKWTSDKPKIVSVGKSNGKVSAKKVTAVASKDGEEDEVVTLTNEEATPIKKYEVTVVSPKLYERDTSGEKSEYYAAKTLNLNTMTDTDDAGSVTLSLKTDVVDKDGEPGSLASFTPAWTSSDPRVAFVTPIDEPGSTDCRVTAVAKGSAKITAWVNGMGYSCTVRVTDIYSKNTPYGLPKEFGLDKDSEGVLREKYRVTLNPATTITLNYNKKKTGFVPKNAEWKYYDADNNEVSAENAPAYVSNKGKLVAVYEGFVTAAGAFTENGKTVRAEFDVSVMPAPAKRETYMAVGKKETLKYYKVNNSKAEWSSSDPTVATVDANGNVKTLKAGYSVITCTYNGVKYNTTVFVEDPTLDTEDTRMSTTDKANIYELKLNKGTRYLIQAPGVYQQINWKSSKDTIAFVDENGIIEGRAAGKANITTKINGQNIKIMVVVE